MSAFGANSNNGSSIADSSRSNQRVNGFEEPRRSGNSGGKKRSQKPGGSNNKGGGSGLSNGPQNGSGNASKSRSSQNGQNDKKKQNAPARKGPGKSTSNNINSGNTSNASKVGNKLLNDTTRNPSRSGPEVLSLNKLQNYSDNEIELTGTLIPQPEKFGFQRNPQKQVKARIVPRYLLSQSRLLEANKFEPNQWDIQNQAKMLQMEAENTTNDYQGLYEAFQKMREIERKQMESFGLVDAENIRKDLNDAISFSGSCTDMCPTFERVRRALENNVKTLEKDPSTNRISRTRAVKAFSRPAAGQPPPLPSDVRPPHILKQTLDYLVSEIVPQLPQSHSFVWDRTRSIRQDFTYQNYFGPEAIDCNERIVRIHLVSLHIMSGSDIEYSQQQELEQFNKALQTLIEIYQDVRNRGGTSPNEAEFRAYYLLSHIRDTELDREIQQLPNEIFNDRHIQLALMFQNIISQNNIVERGYKNGIGALNLFLEFFKFVYSDETPFLMSCLLETQFNEIRFYALKSMSRCYHTRGKAYSAEALKTMLGFDSIGKLISFVQYYEVDVINDNGAVLVDLFNKEKLEKKYKLNSFHDKPKQAQAHSSQIDLKIKGCTIQAFINSGKPVESLNLKPLQEAQFIDIPPSAGPKLPSNSFNFGQSINTPGNHLAALSDAPSRSEAPAFGIIKGPGSTNNSSSFKSDASFEFKPATVPALTGTIIQEPSIFGKPNSLGTNPSPLFSTKPPSSDQKSSTPPSLKFNFGSNASSASNPPEQQLSSKPFEFGIKPSNPSPKPEAAKSTEDEGKASLFGNENLRGSERSIAANASRLKMDKPKMLKDLPHFDRAVAQIFNELLRSVVRTELEKIVSRQIEFYNASCERLRIIESLSKDFYDNLLSHQIQRAIQGAKADQFYNKNLQERVVRIVAEKGRLSASKYEKKRRKIDELNSISFGQSDRNLLKRSGSNSSLSSISSVRRKKIAKTEEADLSYISQKQSEIRQLWEPLDLKAFAEKSLQNIKVEDGLKESKHKFLVVVENWSSPCSKWLNTKLSLTIDKDKMVYVNEIKTKSASLFITSLPNFGYMSKEFFHNTSFILFESGFVHDDQIAKFGSIENKLERDHLVLKKLIGLVKKYGHFKVQILVLFWDNTHSSINHQSIWTSFLAAIDSFREYVGEFVLLDMTQKDQDINEALSKGMQQVSTGNVGDLTKRGLREREKVRALAQQRAKALQPPDTVVPVSDSTFKARERTYIAQGKTSLNKRYEYLLNHLRANTSLVPGSGLSVNNSYASMHNRTIPNLVSNSTFLNLDNTVGNSTVNSIANDSLLTGFGNGVIEESTPFASPKGSQKFARPNLKNVPKSIQQLRELTAGVKAKYKKGS